MARAHIFKQSEKVNRMLMAGRLAVMSSMGFVSAAIAAENFQTRAIELAQEVSDLARDGGGVEHRIQHMHPDVLARTAAQFNYTEPEVLQLVRFGYGSAYQVMKVVESSVFPEHSEFGEKDGWEYGAVPYATRGVLRSTGEAIPPTCDWLLVFSDPEDGTDALYYTPIAKGGEDIKRIEMKILPEPLAFIPSELGAPRC